LPPSLIARLENRTIFIQPGLTFEEEVASIGHEDYHFRFDAQGSDVTKGINTSIKGMNTGLSEDEKILREIRADMYGSLVAVPTLKIFGDLARFRKHSSLSDKLKTIRLYVYKKYKI